MIKELEIIYYKQADKFFNKHWDIRDEFEKLIKKVLYNDHPEQVNFKRLKGNLRGLMRIAIDGYRIIYRVENGKIIIVTVMLAGSRGDVYKHLGKLKSSSV